MKHRLEVIVQYAPWLLLLLGVDAFSMLLLWLADVKAIQSMGVVIVLATILLFLSLCCLLSIAGKKREQAFLDYLNNPDEYHEQRLLGLLPTAQWQSVRQLSQTLRDNQFRYGQLQERLNDYEEYVESWVHETKTPLSLLTLMLDNRRDELPEAVVFKLDYTRNSLQASVDQMLYYARLKGNRKDYLFEPVSIRVCVEEVLEDYRPFLDEKHMAVQCQLSDELIYTDRRGIRFLIGQVVCNAIRYCDKEPRLCFEFSQGEKECILSIKDNGIGVRDCDLPYIFEKGFTGDSGLARKKATGMGLYLVKEMAKDLNLSLHVNTQWGNGFEMQVRFPVVKDG